MPKLNKKEKIIISVSVSVAAVALVFVFLAVFGVLKSRNNYFLFKRVDNGYVVTGFVGDKKDLFIPSSYKGQNVVGIEDSAFFDSKLRDVQSITLPSTLEFIGENSFRDLWSLKSIHIPSSVISIGARAFMNCVSLNSVSFGENYLLQSILPNAFFNTDIVNNPNMEYLVNNILIIDGVAITGFNLSGLSFTIPKQIVVLGADVFYSNQKLSANISVEQDSLLRYISDFAFSNMFYVNSIDLSNANQLVQVGKSAFERNSDLQNLVFPSSLKKVGDFACAYCVDLFSLNFNYAVVDFGKNVFDYCQTVTNISVAGNCTNFEQAFGTATPLLRNINLKITTGTLSLDMAEAFGNKTTNLTLDLSASVQPFALKYFSILSSLVIPANAVNDVDPSIVINSNSAGNNRLFSLTIFGDPSSESESISIRGYNVFKNVEKLRLNNIDIIEDYSFANIYNLKYVWFDGNSDHSLANDLDFVGIGSFINTRWLNSLKTDEDMVVLANTLLFLQQFSDDQIVIPDGIEIIDIDSIYLNRNSTIYLPNSLIFVGAQAISNNTNKFDVELVFVLSDDGFSHIQDIGDFAFFNANVKNISTLRKNGNDFIAMHDSLILDSIENVGQSIFDLDNFVNANDEFIIFGSTVLLGANLQKDTFVVPNGIKVVADFAFVNQNNLIKFLIIPDSVVVVGDSAFVGFNNLAKLDIGTNVSNIGDSAFCITDLTQIVVRVYQVLDFSVIFESGGLLRNEVFVPADLCQIYQSVYNVKFIGF